MSLLEAAVDRLVESDAAALLPRGGETHAKRLARLVEQLCTEDRDRTGALEEPTA